VIAGVPNLIWDVYTNLRDNLDKDGNVMEDAAHFNIWTDQENTYAFTRGLYEADLQAKRACYRSCCMVVMNASLTANHLATCCLIHQIPIEFRTRICYTTNPDINDAQI